jgi:LysR family glycine cleavage system transcriptional activator
MARKLPPLHLLQLFEAAGRHLSFKKAAEELHLTPSAISHQVKALEENLGIVLFTRLTRGVQLTPAGEHYLLVVKDIFARLNQGTTSLKQRFSSQSLRISTIGTIASNIIIPRLNLFQHKFPNIELRIEISTNVIDLRYDECDLGIRIGEGRYPGLHSEKIFDLHVTPMCSAEFYQQHQVQHLEQILELPLIRLSSHEGGWSEWGEGVDISGVESKSTLSLGSYDAAIQAAQQGLGLALGAVPLENINLTSGRLVRPFKEQTLFPQACYAVYRSHDQHRPDIRQFIEWFKQQC